MQDRFFRVLAAVVVAFCLIYGGGMLLLAYNTYQSASYVVGHDEFTKSGDNGQDAGSNTLFNPNRVYTDSGKMFVADMNNHRVLIYDSIPTSDDATASVVVGQPDMYSISANQGGGVNCATNTLNTPRGVFATNSKLFIADSSNNRVLVYNSIPENHNAKADVIVGQPNPTTCSSGNSQTKMNGPRAVFATSTTLFVADTGNHRVLIYNSIPSGPNPSASTVVGQSNFTNNSPNQGGGVNSNTLSQPNDVIAYGGKMYIADSNNDRILVYNSVPGTNDASANVVVGQADLSSSGNACTSQGLNNPQGVAFDGSQLFVGDTDNHRVMVYNTPITTQDTADFVIGQANMTSCSLNQTGTAADVDADTLYSPRGVYSDGSKVYVADYNNNRVTIYNTPIAGSDSAAVAVGQPDKTSRDINQGGSAEADTLSGPNDIYVDDNGKMYIADTGNNRVLIFNSIPTSNNASASVVVGQPDKTSTGIGCTATNLDAPTSVYATGTSLFVVDYNNYRVLEYSPIPVADGAGASTVLGQNNKTTCGQVPPNGSGTQIPFPFGIHGDANYLYVSDEWANRIMAYSLPLGGDNDPADHVLGQADFSGPVPPAACTAAGLSDPRGVYSYNDQLFVADAENNRVLIYDLSDGITDGENALYVVGQTDKVSCSQDQGTGVDADTMDRPYDVYAGPEGLFVADRTNNRVLIFETIPSADGASADKVIGQPDMTSESEDSGGINAYTLDSPYGVYATGSQLFISDRDNNRALIYDEPTAESGRVIRFF